MEITEKLIPLIEKALGFELYEWQRAYLLNQPHKVPTGRAVGYTTTYIVKLLLTNDRLIDIKKDVRRYQDYTASGHYSSFFRHEMRMIDDKLTSVGLVTQSVKPKKVIGDVGGIEVKLDTQKLQQKLRAIAKHTEALAVELDAIDNAWQCDCGCDEKEEILIDNETLFVACFKCGKPIEDDELPTRLEGSD
ncbi:hypothetical protein ACIQ2D_08695 [Lysinibacillus sp. NPDC097287]|uniref:hypothetical protein n=1 Tax=Lysinibacillus sp. NPDC097287 TaxID=3364144 RepID=UPI00381FA9CB